MRSPDPAPAKFVSVLLEVNVPSAGATFVTASFVEGNATLIASILTKFTVFVAVFVAEAQFVHETVSVTV
jgi:hypothetical protein